MFLFNSKNTWWVPIPNLGQLWRWACLELFKSKSTPCIFLQAFFVGAMSTEAPLLRPELKGVSSQPIALDWDGDALTDLILAPEGRVFRRTRHDALEERRRHFFRHSVA